MKINLTDDVFLKIKLPLKVNAVWMAMVLVSFFVLLSSPAYF